MLSWAQFEITCNELKSVVTDVQEMASRDEIALNTDLDALMTPKFDAVLAKKKGAAELKKTETWTDYMEKASNAKGVFSGPSGPSR